MTGNNTVVRSMHDLGLAAWFGGSLMGATGLNGATSKAKDPTERLRLSSDGWALWTPWQIAAVGVHTVGSIGMIFGNSSRLKHQDGATTSAVIKTVVTVAAAGVTAYSGVLGKKLMDNQAEGAEGATAPKASASPELASAQRQLKVCQWLIPALTSVLVVLGAQEGEQQRSFATVLDKIGV
ncbi:MAG: hypothetical protein JWP61_1577 [Friedmanniella sp.]|nr:hypothetical protein [Friedmanniella sp.]